MKIFSRKIIQDKSPPIYDKFISINSSIKVLTMGKIKIYKILFSLIFIFISFKSYSQNQSIGIGVRIVGQADFQKEVFAIGGIFGGPSSLHKAIVFNYALDILAIERNIKGKIDFYVGIGYFRNKFDFKKPYNHQLLNPGTDSIPIGTSAQNYVYSLLRIPLGIDFKLKAQKDIEISLSVENLINSSFLQTYNGSKPFPDANDKLRKFKFYGYNLLLKANITQAINHKNGCYITISPYARIFNLYSHNDPVLYKDDTGNYIRWIDAVGLSLQYSFKLKNKL